MRPSARPAPPPTGYGLSVNSTGDNGSTPGSITIQTNGAITGVINGIYAYNDGTGATSVTATGLVTSGSSSVVTSSGINVLADAPTLGGLTINAGAVDSGGFYGINAVNNGAGATSVTATGAITTSAVNSIGIGAVNNGANSTNLSVSAVDVSANGSDSSTTGINALNSGQGWTQVTSTGTVKGGTGIFVNNGTNTSSLQVQAQDVTASVTGIQAINNGTGLTSVTVNGTSSGGATGDGIFVQSASTSATGGLTISANAASGGVYAIYGENDGGGDTQVSATGAVTATLTASSKGLYALAEGTSSGSLTVSAASVTANGNAIYATNAGTGATSVTATGTVSAGGTGIFVNNSNTKSSNLSVQAATVTATGPDGIYAFNSGTGTTSVETSGSVSGGTYGVNIQGGGGNTVSVTIGGDISGGISAIHAQSSANKAITIITDGVTQTTAGLATNLAVYGSGGPLTYTNNGTLTGRVQTGGSAGILNNNGTWNTAAASATVNAEIGFASIVNAGVINFDQASGTTDTFGAAISSTGSINQNGAGTTILTGANTFTGGTTITAGTLQIGAGGTTGSLTGNVANSGTLAFDRSDGASFGGVVSGNGGISQIGTGTTTLTGANTYAGATVVSAGGLYVSGDQTGATGATSVASGATLGGTGIIGGNVAVAAGGTLSPGTAGNAVGTLTINGGLSLVSGSTLAYSFGQANVVGGAFNDLVNVGGNLTLAGTLNVASPSGGTFGPGVYRVINYSGSLTNDGLAIGTLPSGVNASTILVQTSVANQVNLVNTAGLTLDVWDGTGPKNDGVANGGSGVWQAAAGNDNWTTADGTVNAPWSTGFALFEAAAGTVTVDNSQGQVTAAGMQFASNGYQISGDAITLQETTAGSGQSIIRVGDGAPDGANYTATIASVLQGSTQLVKTDLGTLVLTGANTYTGGTLQVLTDGTNGTVNSLSTGGVSIGSGGTLAVNSAGDFTLANALTGAGLLSATNNGGVFAFGSGVGNAFAGTVAVSNDTFALGGAAGTNGAQNVTALTHATLSVGAGSVTTVADGNQQIGGLTFNGGTMVFDASAPAQTVATSLVTVGNLDVSGTGVVQLNVPASFVLETPTPDGQASLFAQSHVTNGLLLVAATGTVTGSGAGLTLEDQTGAVINDSRNVNIQQDSATVAIGTYDYALGTGVNDNGLYAGYALKTLALQPGQTLTLTENAGATGNDADMAAQLTGSGNLVIAANNVVSLSNPANDFTGTTLVQSGTLQAGAANVIASSSAVTLNAGTTFDTNGYSQSLNDLNGASGSRILLSGNDTLTLNGGAASNTFSGVISGAGSVEQAGGTQILTGANTYTGGTTISGGTLQVGDGGTSGSITGNVVNNGTLVFDRSDAVTFGGVISGSGAVDQSGSGTTTLTGTSTYTGGTTVSGGTLVVNGALTNSVVTVDSGGTLGGTGTVGGIVVQTGTKVMPGSNGGVGTMNVTGNVTFNAGSTYQVALTPSTASRISADGAATIEGGTVSVLAGSGNYAPTYTYTILSASGGVTGTFAGVTSNLAFLDPTLSYDPNDVYLTMTRNDVSFTSVGNTPNQSNAGAGVESLGPNSSLYDAAVRLDANGARNAFEQLAGDLHASLQSALLEDSHFVRDAAFDRLRDGACGVSGSSTATQALNGDADSRSRRPDEGCDADQQVAWSRAFGAWGHTSSDGNAAAVGRDTGGFLSGVDGMLFDHWRGGLFAGYSYTSVTGQGLSASGTSDGYTVGLYLGRQWGDLALRTGAAYTWNVLTTDRSVSFQGFSDRLRGSYDSGTAQPFAELGYSVKVGRSTVLEPFANVAYVNLHTDGFTEQGGAAALTSASGNTSTTFSTLGLRDTSRFALGSTWVTVSGLAGWRHAFGDVTPASALAFANGSNGSASSNFNVAGVPIAKDAAVVDLGLDFAVGENATVELSYDGQFGSGVVDNGVRADFKIRF